MSFSLNQSLSLYIPFIKDDVCLDTFLRIFHNLDIGKVSHVDFVQSEWKSLRGSEREAFVHFEEYYNTQEAYDFQMLLMTEQRAKLWYHGTSFWSISENLSKKKNTAHGRKIKLDLEDNLFSMERSLVKDFSLEEDEFPYDPREELEKLKKENEELRQENRMLKERDLEKDNLRLQATVDFMEDEEQKQQQELASAQYEVYLLKQQLTIQEQHFQMQLDVLACPDDYCLDDRQQMKCLKAMEGSYTRAIEKIVKGYEAREETLKQQLVEMERKFKEEMTANMKYVTNHLDHVVKGYERHEEKMKQQFAEELSACKKYMTKQIHQFPCEEVQEEEEEEELVELDKYVATPATRAVAGSRKINKIVGCFDDLPNQISSQYLSYIPKKSNLLHDFPVQSAWSNH
jgi:molybdenum-dependent DNA-binding transcriptional regulator ModE